jgi:tungstate transport system ATP-binding protein
MVSILPLRLDGVGYAARGIRLLSGVDLSVRAGRRLVILGPNGAGKSLLLRLCHGLIRPDSGRVIWACPDMAAARHAMVFQRPVLLRRSARANLHHALSLARIDRRLASLRTDEALERFGLTRVADRPARVLSGGEQQRLAIARAWALRPEVLFLDEPSAQLDPGAARTIETLIAGLGSEGVTLVMTTHDLGQARRLAEDIAFLHRGRLVESGPADAFFDAPASPEARAFLAGELAW